jgi:hypothetical protein
VVEYKELALFLCFCFSYLMSHFIYKLMTKLFMLMVYRLLQSKHGTQWYLIIDGDLEESVQALAGIYFILRFVDSISDQKD